MRPEHIAYVMLFRWTSYVWLLPRYKTKYSYVDHLAFLVVAVVADDDYDDSNDYDEEQDDNINDDDYV